MSSINRMKIITNAIGELGCHQMPERSFMIRGEPMPLCARCFGVSIGNVISFISCCLGIQIHWTLLVLFMAIMFCDWALQEWRGIVSTNPRRLITGIIGGYAVGFIWWKFVLWTLHSFV